MSQYQSIDQLILGTDASTGNSSSGASSYITQLLAACHACAKAAQSIPTGTEYDYHAASESFQEKVNQLKSLSWTAIACVGTSTARNTPIDTFQDTHLLTDKFRLLTHTIDDALEVVNTHLKYIKKTGRNQHISALELASKQLDSFSIPVSHISKSSGASRKGLSSLEKPQNYFDDPVDNSYTPFRPLIRSKPNALVPLDPAIITGTLAAASPAASTVNKTTADGMTNNTTSISYPHPYAYEISNLELLPQHVQPSDVKPFPKLTDTPCFWIDTVDDLHLLERTLLSADVFAIDVEHHSQRSYQGIVCLLQISTKDQDFLVDTIALRSKLHILNSSFTNPDIVKVLHGCNMDVIWLQRDLGLYLVNIFDTGQASRLLDFKKYSLAALLDHYCSIHVDKQYQTADWRIRPLNREMLVYAREDTHYLIYIYHRMKNELIDRSMKLVQSNPDAPQAYKHLSSVKIKETPQKSKAKSSSASVSSDVPFLLGVCLNRSNTLALASYEKDNTPELTAMRSLYRASNAFSEQQQTLYVELFKWRDRIARELDESPMFILKQDHVIRLCKIQPTTMDALLQVLRPVSVIIQPFLHQILEIVTGIHNLPFISPEMVAKAFRDHQEALSVAHAGRFLATENDADSYGALHDDDNMSMADDDSHSSQYPYGTTYSGNISIVTSADGDQTTVNRDSSLPLLVGFRKEQLLEELGWDESKSTALVSDTLNMMKDIHDTNKQSAELVLQYGVQQYAQYLSTHANSNPSMIGQTTKNGVQLFDANGIIRAFEQHIQKLQQEIDHDVDTDKMGDVKSSSTSKIPQTPTKPRNTTMFDITSSTTVVTPHRGKRNPPTSATATAAYTTPRHHDHAKIKQSLSIHDVLTPQRPKRASSEQQRVMNEYTQQLIQSVHAGVPLPQTSTNDKPLDEDQRNAVERYGEGVKSVEEMGLNAQKSSILSTPQTSHHSAILSPEHNKHQRIVELKNKQINDIPTHIGQIYKQANINRKRTGGKQHPAGDTIAHQDDLVEHTGDPLKEERQNMLETIDISSMSDEDVKQHLLGKPRSRNKTKTQVTPNLFLMEDSSHNPFLKNAVSQLDDTGFNPNQLRPTQSKKKK